jgi:hypothetical protein
MEKVCGSGGVFNFTHRCAQHGRDLPVKVWDDEDNEVISQEQGCLL